MIDKLNSFLATLPPPYNLFSASRRNYTKNLVLTGTYQDLLKYYRLHYELPVAPQNVLHLALQDKRYDLALEVLIQGEIQVDLEAQNPDGDSPLMLTVLANRLDIVRELVEKGVNVNCREHGGATPLIAAAANGFLDILELLIQEGADLEATNHEGQTCLHRAAYYGQLKTLIALVMKHRIGMRRKDGKGNTCFHTAAYGLSVGCLRFLLTADGAEELAEIENQQKQNFYDILVERFNLIREQTTKPVTLAQVKEYILNKNTNLDLGLQESCW